MAENPRIEELRRRLEREPGSRLFAQLAEELRKEGNQEEAIRVARAGLAQQPNYPSARMTLGRALLDSGDLGGARLEFETVLRGAPDNILASRHLAECLEGLGDLGSALLQYRAAQRHAPADKNLEAQIRALEQKLSAPTMVRQTVEAGAPPPPPLVAAAPRVPAPRPRSSVTAEFETPAGSRTAAAPMARPPLPLPPEPPPAPTLVEESFDLEAPFVAPTKLHAEESPTLPGRGLPEEAVVSEAPTLPATPAPTFDPLPLAPPVPSEEPALIPEPPRAPLAEPRREMPSPRMEERTMPSVSTPEPAPVSVSPTPPPPPVPPAPTAEPAGAQWRAPAPPRVRGLDETPEMGSHQRAAAPAASESDTTRVPVVVYPVPAAAPKPALDVIRLEWAPAPATPPPAAEIPAPPVAPPPPVASPPTPPAAPAAPAPEPGPLLSSTLAELYFGQGALDKAVEVYEHLLQREPANERHRSRLAEIRRAAAPPPVPADDQRAARRQVIEAQIARLEQLLTVVKRA